MADLKWRGNLKGKFDDLKWKGIILLHDNDSII